MSPKQLRKRWLTIKGRILKKKVITSLLLGKSLDNINELKKNGEHFDLRGIQIENEMLNISNANKIDFTYAYFKNMKCMATNRSTVASLIFNQTNMENLSFNNIDLHYCRLNNANIKDSDFSGMNFFGENYLRESNFINVNFSDVHFEILESSDSDINESANRTLKRKRNEKIVLKYSVYSETSEYSDLTGSKFNYCSLNGMRAKKTVFHSSSFDNSDLRKVLFVNCKLTGIVFKDCVADLKTKFQFEKSKKREKKRYSENEKTFNQIKNLYKDNGMSRQSSEYYYKEKVMNRKVIVSSLKQEVFTQKIKNSLEWAFSWFFSITCGYGTKILRVVGVSILIICLSAFIFYVGGITPDNNQIIRFDIVKNIKLILTDISICFYLSLSTFSTLGYGDWTPMNGISKVVANAESILGYILLALFIATLRRRFE